jgi:hypothetical protein
MKGNNGAMGALYQPLMFNLFFELKNNTDKGRIA